MVALATACGGESDRPPYIDPAACRGGQCTDPTEAGDGGPAECDPRFAQPGDAVVSGTVLSLDDPTFSLETLNVVNYARLETFDGRARVEIDSGGCVLASAETEPDGTFTVEGVRAVGDYNYIRVIPLEAGEPYVTTINQIPSGDRSGLRVPVLTRRALQDVFSYLASPPEIDEAAGHVITKVVDAASKSPYQGATVSGLGGVTAYDDGVSPDGTGSLGLALFLNVPAPAYPGEPRVFNVKGSSDVTGTTVLAEGAVSILLIGMGTF